MSKFSYLSEIEHLSGVSFALTPESISSRKGSPLVMNTMLAEAYMGENRLVQVEVDILEAKKGLKGLGAFTVKFAYPEDFHTQTGFFVEGFRARILGNSSRMVLNEQGINEHLVVRNKIDADSFHRGDFVGAGFDFVPKAYFLDPAITEL